MDSPDMSAFVNKKTPDPSPPFAPFRKRETSREKCYKRRLSSYSFQQLFHIIRKRTRKRIYLLLEWVEKGKFLAVQRLAANLFPASTIQFIPNERMPNMGQMNANLVSAACL